MLPRAENVGQVQTTIRLVGGDRSRSPNLLNLEVCRDISRFREKSRFSGNRLDALPRAENVGQVQTSMRPVGSGRSRSPSLLNLEIRKDNSRFREKSGL